jgi:hypothetical protein
MKRIHLDTRRSMVILADAIEQDGDQYLIKSGRKSYKIPACKVAYIEEDGLATLPTTYPPGPSTEAPLPVLGRQDRPPVLSKTLSEAIQRNMATPATLRDQEESLDVPLSITLEGDGVGKFHVYVDAASAASSDVNEKIVGQIFSSQDISLALKDLAVVGFSKAGDSVILKTKKRPPPGKINMPAALTNMLGQVGGMMVPGKLPNINEVPGEDT